MKHLLLVLLVTLLGCSPAQVAEMESCLAQGLTGPVVRVSGASTLFVGDSHMALACGWGDVVSYPGHSVSTVTELFESSEASSMRYETIVLWVGSADIYLHLTEKGLYESDLRYLAALLRERCDHFVMLTPSMPNGHSVGADLFTHDPRPWMNSNPAHYMPDGLHLTPKAWIAYMRSIQVID